MLRCTIKYSFGLFLHPSYTSPRLPRRHGNRALRCHLPNFRSRGSHGCQLRGNYMSVSGKGFFFFFLFRHAVSYRRARHTCISDTVTMIFVRPAHPDSRVTCFHLGIHPFISTPEKNRETGLFLPFFPQVNCSRWLLLQELEVSEVITCASSLAVFWATLDLTNLEQRNCTVGVPLCLRLLFFKGRHHYSVSALLALSLGAGPGTVKS